MNVCKKISYLKTFLGKYIGKNKKLNAYFYSQFYKYMANKCMENI